MSARGGEGIRIDPATGDVWLSTMTVGPRLSLTTFEATPMGAASTRTRTSPEHVRCELPDVEDGDVRMRVHLFFEGDVLRSVELCAVRAPTDEEGWRAWSEDDERARNAVHSRWLVDKGLSAGRHPWGRLHAGYDARRGGSLIALHYDALAADTKTLAPRFPLTDADPLEREQSPAAGPFSALIARLRGLFG